MKISIIIPTRNRSKFLANLLCCILKQTRLPDEVIIVDDSDTDETAKLTSNIFYVFFSNGITFKYLKGNKKNRSTSAARNLGIDESSGEILFFIDDDVILDNNYISEILKIYEKYPEAKGAQGYIVNGVFEYSNFKTFLLNAVKKVFCVDHIEKNKCTFNMGLTYPHFPDEVIRCEWLHGTNMSFKKEVLANFRFDENLKRRSIGEDVDLATRINKLYPNTLFMNPEAKISHLSVSRAVDKYSIYSKFPYIIYLNTKNKKPIFKNTFLILWFFLGLILIKGGMALFFSKDVEPFFCTIKSFFVTFSHLGEAKKADFRFIESML